MNPLFRSPSCISLSIIFRLGVSTLTATRMSRLIGVCAATKSDSSIGRVGEKGWSIITVFAVVTRRMTLENRKKPQERIFEATVAFFKTYIGDRWTRVTSAPIAEASRAMSVPDTPFDDAALTFHTRGMIKDTYNTNNDNFLSLPSFRILKLLRMHQFTTKLFYHVELRNNWLIQHP